MWMWRQGWLHLLFWGEVGEHRPGLQLGGQFSLVPAWFCGLCLIYFLNLNFLPKKWEQKSLVTEQHTRRSWEFVGFSCAILGSLISPSTTNNPAPSPVLSYVCGHTGHALQGS